MTQIEKMVRECGTGGWQTFDDMVRFAKKVAAAEREECAKACEAAGAYRDEIDMAYECAQAVRARAEL